MALRHRHLPSSPHLLLPHRGIRPSRPRVAAARVDSPQDARKLVLEVKERLGKEFPALPVGTNGRDDEGMIYWFLNDRKFVADDAFAKLAKAIKWRQEFEVSKLTEESVEEVSATGKASVHDHLDVSGRPVLIVVAAKHFPNAQDPVENEKLSVFLIEKALSKLPAGKEQILGIFDLRGFGTANADLKFLTFMFDVFYYYYPKRLGQVLLVDAPFVFKPLWQIAKPLLRSYASLVRFCSADNVRRSTSQKNLSLQTSGTEVETFLLLFTASATTVLLICYRTLIEKPLDNHGATIVN